MSKKLLIAVFTLGLFLINGVAFTSDNPGDQDRVSMYKPRPNAPLAGDHKVLPQFSDQLERPIPTNMQSITTAPLLPPPYYCEFIDYSGGAAAYYQEMPTSHPVDSANMRFTPGEGYCCTLLTLYVATYSDGFVGTPDLSVFVWDDDGFGDPGNLLFSTTIPYASIVPGMTYQVVDVSAENLVFCDGAEFHVGGSTEGASAAAGNRIALLVDDGESGTGRHRINYGGSWTTWTTDYNYLMGVDICCADIPYTDCYHRDYSCNVYWYYPQPSPYGDELYNQRFTPDCPETLTSIGVAFYGGETYGTPDAELWVTSSLDGFPDLSDVIYSTVVPNASLMFYPDYTEVDLTAENIVVRGEFHIGWSVIQNDPGDNLPGLSDAGECPELRSSAWYNGGWMTLLDLYGEDDNFLISADLCKDEFCLCDRIINYCDPYYVYSMPHSGGSGRIAGYQKMEPVGLGCRLEDVRIALYTFGDPWNFTYTAEMQICDSDVDDFPINDPPLLSKVIGPGQPDDYVVYPGTNDWDVSDQNILFDRPIYVGIMTHHPDPYGATLPIPDWYLLGDDDGCGGDNAVSYYPDGHFNRYTGSNFIIDAYVCCVPPPERDCETARAGEDWTTSGHDMMRTAASFNATGDARCKQTLSWSHSDPIGFIYGRPIIYDGIVLAPYNDKLQAFDIDGDGTTPLWTVTGLPWIGSGFRNSVTVKDGVVYFGGGNARSFNAFDVYLGTEIWSRNVLPTTPAACAGNTDYTTSIILDCDGTEVVFFGTAAGELYAVEAATGLLYGGWAAANPAMLDGNVLHTLSSNGADMLYVGTDGTLGTGYGTLYAIDACTGVTTWSLGDGDLYGYDIDGDDTYALTTEIFQGPIGCDPQDGSIYVQSAFDSEIDGGPSAAHYKISSGGSIVWGVPGKFPRFTGPVIDANAVIMTTLRGWSSENLLTVALKKINGSTLWQSSEEFNAMNWNEGALSCEPLERDLLYTGNMDAQFLAINADDGVVEFEYNYDDGGSNRGCGAAIDASHVVFNNRQGDLYVFTEQVDRPRLRILISDELQPVPFLSPPSYPVTYEAVFMNNGCANLNGNITIDEIEPAFAISAVDPLRTARMKRAANNMLDNSYQDMARNLVKAIPVDQSTLDAEFTESPYAKDSYSNEGAYGPPAWLNSIVVDVFDLAPGQAFDVQYDVNGPLVTRGPHRAYVTIISNDAYYLNSTSHPYIQLGVLGGCLEAADILAFGTSEQNVAPVYNTGELGNQEGDLFSFDGDDAAHWQGFLIIATEPLGGPADAPFRQAFTGDSWHGGDPPDYWNSLLPEINCFEQCEPYVTPDPILLGRMSHDGGATYDDVMGYAATYAYIDSVQDFDCDGGGWNWDNITCPFDNALTMGMRVDETMYGVIGEAAFNEVIIYKHQVTNRNAAAIADINFCIFDDFDLEANASDYYYFDAATSVGWGASSNAPDPNNTKVYGRGKIPMDVDPMIGVRTCDAQQTMWDNAHVGLDSMYIWMDSPGAMYQAGITYGSESDDRDGWFGLMKRDFDADEVYTFGHFMFGFGAADPDNAAQYTDLAVLVNQLCGFQRGDINIDGAVNLADAVALWNMVNGSGNGPLFEHLADVNADGAVDNGDVLYMFNFHFCAGPAPLGTWALPDICP
jgi:hypothetical protein